MCWLNGQVRKSTAVLEAPTSFEGVDSITSSGKRNPPPVHVMMYLNFTGLPDHPDHVSRLCGAQELYTVVQTNTVFSHKWYVWCSRHGPYMCNLWCFLFDNSWFHSIWSYQLSLNGGLSLQGCGRGSCGFENCRSA